MLVNLLNPPQWQGLLTSWHYQSLISQFSLAVPTNSSVCIVKSYWETQAKNQTVSGLTMSNGATSGAAKLDVGGQESKLAAAGRV
jgi:hypothetical protein